MSSCEPWCTIVASSWPGIVVWIGEGDDLFAAAGHGYDTRVLDVVPTP